MIRQAATQAMRIGRKATGEASPTTHEFDPPDPRSAAVMDIHRRAMLSYRPRKYQGRVLVFRPHDEEPLVHGDASTGWRRYARNLTPFVLPGEHFTCLTHHSHVLASHLRPYCSPDGSKIQTP